MGRTEEGAGGISRVQRGSGSAAGWPRVDTEPPRENGQAGLGPRRDVEETGAGLLPSPDCIPGSEVLGASVSPWGKQAQPYPSRGCCDSECSLQICI